MEEERDQKHNRFEDEDEMKSDSDRPYQVLGSFSPEAPLGRRPKVIRSAYRSIGKGISQDLTRQGPKARRISIFC